MDLLNQLIEKGVLQLGVFETIYMTFISAFFSYLFGLPLGVLLSITEKGGICPVPWLNKILGFIVNIFRSIPFVILMIADLPLLTKCVIVGLCNLIGVYIVKWAEERARKAKLWKVELTVRNEEAQKLHENLNRFNIPHNYIPNVGKWTIFNAYCATQKESHFTKEIANKAHAKYFVTETKEL